MPLSPVVRSCGRHANRRCPSTRDNPELLTADAALNLTRPLRLLEIQPRIRRTPGAAGKSLKDKVHWCGKVKRAKGVHRCATHKSGASSAEIRKNTWRYFTQPRLCLGEKCGSSLGGGMWRKFRCGCGRCALVFPKRNKGGNKKQTEKQRWKRRVSYQLHASCWWTHSTGAMPNCV